MMPVFPVPLTWEEREIKFLFVNRGLQFLSTCHPVHHYLCLSSWITHSLFLHDDVQWDTRWCRDWNTRQIGFCSPYKRCIWLHVTAAWKFFHPLHPQPGDQMLEAKGARDGSESEWVERHLLMDLNMVTYIKASGITLIIYTHDHLWG